MRLDDYSQICSFENLYRAHMAARRGKQANHAVISFEMDLAYNLRCLQLSLKDGSYQLAPYEQFTIHEPKERRVFAPRYPDRVVQHCLCDNILKPLLEPRLIYDNAACRKGKGTHFSIGRLSRFMREHWRTYSNKGYILKCDIRKYFDTIKHDILLERLGHLVFDRDTLALMQHIIGSYNTAPGIGLPLGNQTSQWLALYYLDGIDRLVKEKLRIRAYVRYMDDSVFLHHDRGYLAYCLESMREATTSLGLRLNNKTQIAPLASGVDYLGFHHYLTANGKVLHCICGRKKLALRRRLMRCFDEFAHGVLTHDELAQRVQSYQAHLSYGQTASLRALAHRNFVEASHNMISH